MKNSYLIAGAIVVVAIIAFVVASRKSEAPVEKVTQNEQAGVTLTDGNYKLDTDQSTIRWTGETVTGLKKYEGTVKVKSGTVMVEQGGIKSGSFEIDMQTLTDDLNTVDLVSHLKSSDFFAVDAYPLAKFEITSFAPISEASTNLGRYVIGGNLTIKDVTKPISLIATLSETENKIRVSASFAINRAEWNVKFGSSTFFEGLGDKAVRDAIEINMDLVATQSD